MSPEVNNQSPEAKAATLAAASETVMPPNRRRLRVFLPLLIILLALVALAAYHYRVTKSTQVHINVAKLQNYTACPTAGQRMNFKKPAEFNFQGVYDNENRLSATHSASGYTYTLGFIAAACQKPTTLLPAPDAAFLKTFDQAVLNPSDPNHSRYLLPAFVFINQRVVTSDYQVKPGSVNPFSNSYIKSNAWKIDFAFVKKSDVAVQLPSEKQGALILAAGKNTWYYLMLSATKDSWQANQAAWSAIEGSLQIDQ